MHTLLPSLLVIFGVAFLFLGSPIVPNGIVRYIIAVPIMMIGLAMLPDNE